MHKRNVTSKNLQRKLNQRTNEENLTSKMMNQQVAAIYVFSHLPIASMK